MNLVEDAADLARSAHEGQLYGGRPYFEAHLVKVAQVLRDFGFGGDYEAAGLLHDVVEDCGVTVEQLRARFGDAVADRVWACTGEGEGRAARGAAIYAKLAACPSAAVVKLADRIANVEAAPEGSRHRALYREEAGAFAAGVKRHVPPAMWARLERALGSAD